MKKMHKILLGASILSSLMGAYVLEHVGDNPEEEIASGELSDTKRCGWIDWDHARKGNALDLIQRVLAEEGEQKGKHYHLEYNQKMGKNLGPLKIRGTASQTYKIRRGLSQKQRLEVALTIYRKGSENFESMQASFPYNLAKNVRESAFEQGQLNSNLTGFYAATLNLNQEQIEEICGRKNKEDSLARLTKEGMKKSKKWDIEELPELFRKIDLYSGEKYIQKIAEGPKGLCALSIEY